MSDRWAPTFAAVVGLVGGLGGAFIGGWVANQGQQQRFENERAAQIQDLRRDTYVKYLRATEREQHAIVDPDDETVLAAAAEVSLVASAEVQGAAEDLVASVLSGISEAEYKSKRDRFIELAQREARADE